MDDGSDRVGAAPRLLHRERRGGINELTGFMGQSNSQAVIKVERAAGGDEDLSAPTRTAQEALIDASLDEDLGPRADGGLTGDLTSRALGLHANGSVMAKLIAKASGCVAGTAVFEQVFERLARRLGRVPVHVDWSVKDGDLVRQGDLLARFSCAGDLLLVAERTALNFLQRLSGVATSTRRYVDAVAGTGAAILDTRKTTPGLRLLEKAAVKAGGGVNHRIGLYDQVLIKENHFAAAKLSIAAGVARAREHVGEDVLVIAEVETEEEALEAARSGADVVMLDNFTPRTAKQALDRLRANRAQFPRPVATEVSGGITLETVREWAATGVERISIGALTHSATALDISLLVDGLGGPE